MTKIIQIISYPKACSTKITQLLVKRMRIDAFHEPEHSILSIIAKGKDAIIVKNTVDDFDKMSSLCESVYVSRVQQPIIFITMSPTELFLNITKQRILDNFFDNSTSTIKTHFLNVLKDKTDYISKSAKSLLETMQDTWEYLKDKDTLCFTKDELMTDPISVTDEIIDKLGMESYRSELELAPMEYGHLDHDNPVSLDKLLHQSEEAKYWLMHDDSWLNEKARTDQYFEPLITGFNQDKKIDEISRLIFNGIYSKINGVTLETIKQEVLKSLKQFELEVNNQGLNCNFEKD